MTIINTKIPFTCHLLPVIYSTFYSLYFIRFIYKNIIICLHTTDEMSQRKKIIIICLHITDEMSQRKKNIYVFANILEKKKEGK